MLPDCVLFAYAFDGKGGAKPLGTKTALTKTGAGKTLTWVHLDASTDGARELAETLLPAADTLTMDTLFAPTSRPRIVPLDKAALIILRGVNLNDNADPEDMVSIRTWVDASHIVSVRLRPIKAVRDIEANLLAGNGPKNAGEFLCALTNRLFDRMQPVLTSLDEQTDDVEEIVAEKADTHLRATIVDIRKTAIMLRRYLAPQRDAIGMLKTSELPFLDTIHKRRLQESHDQITRYVEDLDAIRERAQIVKDELATALADQLNKNMYLLSVVAAIFLPLGFLTGLLGINVGGIPGADNPEAFWLFAGGLSVLVFLQVVLFKLLKWL